MSTLIVALDQLRYARHTAEDIADRLAIDHDADTGRPMFDCLRLAGDCIRDAETAIKTALTHQRRHQEAK